MIRALLENTARSQSNERACEDVADQGQHFSVKPKQNLLTKLSTKTLKKNFLSFTSVSFFYFLYILKRKKQNIFKNKEAFGKNKNIREEVDG